MKVLMLLSQTEITGAEVHAVQLGEWLHSRGHRVYLISDTLTVKTSLPYLQRAIHPKGFTNRLSNILFLCKFIREHQIDVLHAHSRAAVRVGFWACAFSSAALVATVHGRQHFSWSKRIFNLYGQQIIAVCKNIQRHLEIDFGLKHDFITVVGNPVHSPTAPLSPLQPTAPIAIVGRTSGPKGEQTKLLIRDVLPKLLAQFPNLKIHLLGGPVETLGSVALHQIEALNRIYPDCLKAISNPDLDSALKNYQLIFGAGRVAISALLRGVPVWAIGESASLGIVTAENFVKYSESNFGDIGESQINSPPDPTVILQELARFLTHPRPSDQDRAQLQQIALRYFDFSSAARRIEATYKAALLFKNHPRHIPILMYHMVLPAEIQTQHKIFVTTAQFSRQLAAFKKWGFETLNFKDLESFTSGERSWSTFPRKPLILTFDDGYANNLTEALPILKKYQFKAVIYLLADPTIQSNHWDAGEIPLQPLMTASQRQELFRSGSFEIGSHGIVHEPLTKMTPEMAQRQLNDSKTMLEKEFGAPILSYAFTYGLRTDALAAEAANCGYQFIINTDQGGLSLSQPITSIFRTPIFPQDKGFKLWRKVQPWYRRYFYLTRKK